MHEFVCIRSTVFNLSKLIVRSILLIQIIYIVARVYLDAAHVKNTRIKIVTKQKIYKTIQRMSLEDLKWPADCLKYHALFVQPFQIHCLKCAYLIF